MPVDPFGARHFRATRRVKLRKDESDGFEARGHNVPLGIQNLRLKHWVNFWYCNLYTTCLACLAHRHQYHHCTPPKLPFRDMFFLSSLRKTAFFQRGAGP